MPGRPTDPPQMPVNGLFGPGTRTQGDLSFEGRVRVDGHFIGRVYTEDLLEVGPEGMIEGEADVARAVIGGTIKGRLRVREHLLLECTGLVEGQLDAGVVELRPGARIEARVRIRGEEMP